MRRLLAILLLLLPLPLAAQDMASLVADRLAIAGQDVLVAEGNVEVFHQGRRLRATRITYNGSTDRLTIEGPLVLTDDSGTFLLADSADLSADLAEGVLTSARLVLNRQLQLAASEVQRIGGRYTRLGRTVASSCRVCAGDGAPLWEIRARRVIHDTVERQIYFDRAQLRIAGMPVALIPRLRMPDPTLKRATGVLIPELRSSSDLGTGLRIPYFIRLGDHRDLTLLPYLSTNAGRTLGLRYRQAFASGSIEFSGALSRDRIRPGETRGYVFLDGGFALANGFRLTLRGEAVTDPGYFIDYGITDRDRLISRIDLTRTRRDEYISARLTHFRSIREGDVNSRLPSILGDFTYTRRFRPAVLGGTGALTFQTHSHYRSADLSNDSDGDGIGDGRDMARATLRLNWRREMTFGPGLQFAALAEGAADVYGIRQDDLVAGTQTRLSGGAGFELRWPLVRAEAGGAMQVLEPVVQVMWSPDRLRAIPNEDSVLAEFDEGNLFSTRRFPGNDGVERGRRVNAGLTFSRISASGATVSLAFGRILRDHDEDGFSAASGLAGQRSDWLAAVRYNPRPGLSLTGRAVIDDDAGMTKGELRIDLDRPRYALSSSYIWMRADATEGRSVPVSELLVDARYDVTEAWTTRLATRYDFEANRAASAGIGLAWRNECLKVDLSLSRRFTSSTSVTPRTDWGLSVELLGFGGGSAPGPTRQCRG
ncbi:MAG: LPS-assembly protein LptD [Paracoccaceae bacterium]|nr:MAG: LPS-assembly protein LptD [Paracoccaceae bacterium]